MNAEDLFKMLQNLSLEERKQRQVFIQVPSGEYEAYFTKPLKIETGNVDMNTFQMSDEGTPAICFITEE